MAINSPPTTAKKINNTDTLQVGPPENLAWYHEDPPDGHVPYSQFIFTNYTTPNGPQLACHIVSHQY